MYQKKKRFLRGVSVILSLLMVISVISFPTLRAKADGVDDFIGRCYKVTLGRDADADGYAYWRDILVNRKQDGSVVAHGFLFSPEYINKKTSNEQYIKDLYMLFMGREPEKSGYDYWCEKMANGASREQIFAGFANSKEYYDLCYGYGITAGYYSADYGIQQVNGVNLFVERMYQTSLGRLGDQGGQNDWVQALLEGRITGVECARCFVQSPEFINKGLSDEDYLKSLYRAFMGREYDQGGLDYWLDKMNNGYTRDEVFAGFANSPEFERICANYGITRGTYSAKDIGIKKYIEIKKSEAPVGLEEFLSNFAWVVTYGDGYEEYNSETQQGIESLAIRFFGPVSELDIYPKKAKIGEINSYDIYDGEATDWILKNIYNLNDNSLIALKNGSILSSIEYSNGQYKEYAGGVGGGYKAQISQILFNGQQYYVKYDIYQDNFNGGYEPCDYKTHYALLENKNIEGRCYWSIFKDSINPLNIEGLISNQSDIELSQAAKGLLDFVDSSSGPKDKNSMLKNVWKSSNLRFQLAYINDDDIPELIVDNPGYAVGIYYYNNGNVEEVFCRSYGTWGNSYSYLEKKSYVLNSPYGYDYSDEGTLSSYYNYYYPVINSGYKEYYNVQTILYTGNGSQVDLGTKYYCDNKEINENVFLNDANKKGFYDSDSIDISNLTKYTKKEIRTQLLKMIE